MYVCMYVCMYVARVFTSAGVFVTLSVSACASLILYMCTGVTMAVEEIFESISYGNDERAKKTFNNKNYLFLTLRK